MRLRQRVREYAYQRGYGIDEEAEELVLNGGAGVPPGSLVPGRLLAVQIAKNKLTPDDDLAAVVRDHVYCVDRLGRYADVIVVNVSAIQAAAYTNSICSCGCSKCHPQEDQTSSHGQSVSR